MRILVYRRYSKGIAVFSVLVFIALLGVLGKVAIMNPSVRVYLLTGAVAGGSVILLVVFLLKYRREEKVISWFIRTVSIGETVIFPVSLSYAVGIYRCRGEWKGGRNRYYYYAVSDFTEKWKGKGTTVEIPEAPFVVVIKRDGSGLIEFPAVKILTGPFRGLMILFMTPKGKVTGSGHVEVTWKNDLARLSFEGHGKELRGNVRSVLVKSKRSVVEIFNRKSESNVFRVGEGLNFTFSKRLLPDEDVVIVTYGNVSPRELHRLFLSEKFLGDEFEYLLGHGTYGIRLSLDVPLHRNVSGEEKFKVTFEEGGEKESII